MFNAEKTELNQIQADIDLLTEKRKILEGEWGEISQKMDLLRGHSSSENRAELQATEKEFDRCRMGCESLDGDMHILALKKNILKERIGRF